VITVLLNPRSGTAQTAERRDRVAALFDATGVAAEVQVLRAGPEAAEAAGAAVARGATAVVAGGGDGTVSAVASTLAGSSVTLGVLPLGTLNHFAKDARIPVDLAQAVATIAAGHVAYVDVGEVNGRTFVNNSSIGVYPDIVVEREKLRRQGHRKWMAFALASVRIVRRYRGLRVRLSALDTSERARTAFVFVGNNEYDADGLDLGSRRTLDAGRLYTYLAPRIHARELPKLLGLALMGRASSGHVLESFGAESLIIDTPRRRRLRVANDGEVIVMTPPLAYRIRPRSLRVFVPER
jgi:diacylglycerol kinase family enzyme